MRVILRSGEGYVKDRVRLELGFEKVRVRVVVMVTDEVTRRSVYLST